MKKIFAYVLVLGALVVPAVLFAAEFRAGENPSVERGEKISDDVYIAGGGVTSAGAVAGDLIIGGASVVISGDVAEDVMAGGGTVSILSNVGDDVRAGGGTIVINGKVAGDVILGGGQVSISGEGIGGDVVIGGGNVRIDAPIAGDLIVGGGNVLINAPVGGNVKIEADAITLGKSAVIAGNITYTSRAELIKEAGAVVNGTVDFTQKKSAKSDPRVYAAMFSIGLLWKLLTLLVSALLIGLALRRYSQKIVEIAFDRSLSALGRGVVVMIVMPIVSVALLVTLVGIPLGIVGLLGFAIVMICAWIVTPIILGSVVYHYATKEAMTVSWKTILLGVVLFVLGGAVPFIGGLAQALLVVMTLGVMATFKIRMIKEWR